jgi:dipeptidyl aminopeptidase/acylaminoacyl peptidase
LPSLDRVETVIGDEETSIFQPEFSPNGRYLAYVSDRSGWWQLYLYDLVQGSHHQVTHADAEHGLPGWVQGMRTFAFDAQGRKLYFLRNLLGSVTLWQYDLSSLVEAQVPLDDSYETLDAICSGPAGLGLIASGPGIPPRAISCRPWEPVRPVPTSIHCRTSSEELPPGDYSFPQAIEWPGMDGEPAHGLFYPPNNLRFTGSGSPPLMVFVHGGPTSQVRNNFNPRAQYFTSRGYAVLEVNHRGSTGYGRPYRNMLRGNWGIYDVQDSVSGVRSLAAQGAIDSGRAVIMGGSAGGYTVLKALEDFPGFFKAGICLYGVSNQFTLAAETHKFEARYSDTLLGSLPEAGDIYRERSPIFFVDKIQDPIAMFQGDEDNVVPRNQSDEVVDSLRRRGVPHIYHVYPGEGHGFRKPETIEHFYKAVEQFLRQYVIFA